MEILGHEIEVEDEDDGGLVTDVIVLVRKVRIDNYGNAEDALFTYASPSVTSMVATGMYEMARSEQADYFYEDEGDG